MGVSQRYGYLFGGPHKKDDGILGSIVGSPQIVGNYQLEFRVWGERGLGGFGFALRVDSRFKKGFKASEMLGKV